MTVGELKKELEGVPEDTIVVMSRDGEGNSYSPLYDVNDNYNYLPDSTYSGEIGLRELTEDDISMGYDEEDLMDDEDAIPALVLWPTN